MGAFPDKAIDVLRGVALRMEEWLREEQFGGVALHTIAQTPDGRVSEEVSE
jgi:pyruvate kinase